MLVCVADEHGKGRAGGFALKNAGEDLDFIRFFPGGGRRGLTGSAPVHLALDKVRIDRQTCRETVNGYAQRRSVGFPEGGDGEKCSKSVVHIQQSFELDFLYAFRIFRAESSGVGPAVTDAAAN